MTILLFEDAGVAALQPATIGRPAFGLSCGSYRLIDQVGELGNQQGEQPLRAIVRPHLRELLAADMPELTGDDDEGPTLLVNARVVPSRAAREVLRKLLASGKPGVARGGEAVAAALLPAGATLPAGARDPAAIVQHVEGLGLEPLDAELPLLEYPHDLVRYHLRTMADNLEQRLAEGTYREVADGVFAAEGARLGEHLVFDTTGGPVVLEKEASIGPYCFLQGPAHVGSHARVIEHSAIKDCVALGHTTKIGGEVEASIIEPYTNKQHHGFMGHSYLGSWINLGAGTCNSDLKNTYGQVNMEYDGHKVATGMQFIGAIVGDYAKTAINTGIFTGKTIGACSMVYGFVTTNVPSFVNYARLFGQVTATPVGVMVATQARMFARRNVEQRPCDVQLLHDMYELTRHERELGSVPPEPLSL